MGACQRKSRQVVVERSAPGERSLGMALLAVGAEARRRMWRTGRCQIRAAVTAVAVDRNMDVFVFLLIFVARLAGGGLMRANQLEPGLAVPLGHVGHEPRLWSMASLAGVSQLVAVNVRVTVGAL